MKRYLVFEFDQFYPVGGLSDCEFETDNLEEALERVNSSRYDAAYILDLETREVIPIDEE